MSSPSETGPPISIRRSATLPSRLISQNRASNEGASSSTGNDEVLFFHPSAKIVKFAPETPPGISQSTSSPDLDYPVDTIETLPWRSPTERTVAVGRLRLERVHGLAPFLKCGTVVQPILKNSQCWCVDGKSTFVLRIRSWTYYRIELPAANEDDEKLVAQLKDALPKVLLYELTPCPFQRGFSVEIPKEARAPKKKKAWRPKERRESAPVISGVPSGWPDDSDLVVAERPRSAGESEGHATDDSTSTSREDITELMTPVGDVQPSAPIDIVTPRAGRSTRSVTEPPQTVNNVLARFQPIPESDSEDEVSLSSSVDSFHSLLRSSSPPATSPPSSPRGIGAEDLYYTRQRPHHTRDISEITVTPDIISSATQTTPSLIQRGSKTRLDDESAEKDAPTAPSNTQRIVSHSSDATTSGADVTQGSAEAIDRQSATRRHMKSSRKRSLSPMPPSSTLFYPGATSSTGHLTSSLFRKTCSLVLVPPLQLLLLLIHIAAQIAAGDTAQSASSGSTLSKNEGEDDFGIPTTPGATAKFSHAVKDDDSEGDSDLD